MSTELHTLTGAFALDAVSAEEAEQFRQHLAACAACRQEVHELQAAAATMGASETAAPPPYLKSKVLAAVDRTPQVPPRAGGGGVVEPPRARWLPRLLVVAAAAAVLVVALFGIGRLESDVPEQDVLAEKVVRVFEAEDANTATVETVIGGEVAVATSPELDQMAVDTHQLPPLDRQHVYQLWAVRDGAMQSVGVVEREKGAAMNMPEPETVVAITVEPAGGSSQPTTEPIMQVNPSEV